jgi:hypothetical protein
MATAKPEFEGEEFEFPDEKEAKARKFKADKAEDDAELKIEIEDDTPPQDRGRKPMKEPVEDPTEDELASYDEKVQQRIKKFTRGFHDERRAKEAALREREAAEAFAKQVYEENKRLKEQLSTGSKAYIETSKTAAQAELESAKEKYRKAYDAGDADAIVAAQEAIAKATVKLDKAETLKPIEHEEKDEFVPAKAKAKDEDNTPKVSPRTQRWMESNSEWFGVDEEMTMAAMGIDKKLQREYGPDYVGTDEYFQKVDQTMRKRFPEYFESQSQEDDDPPPRKRSAPVQEDDEPPRRASKPATVVAPASRSSSPSRIRLKASEAAIARRLGVPLEQYAKQVALLTRGE